LDELELVLVQQKEFAALNAALQQHFVDHIYEVSDLRGGVYLSLVDEVE
jgi:hypothetical protein